MSGSEVVVRVSDLVRAGHYRVRFHAVQHMIEEGFDESHLVEALTGKLSVVEEYQEAQRCLLLGYFHFTPRTRSPLHLVCDMSHAELVDIVTAYIPQRPWWISPTRRGDRR